MTPMVKVLLLLGRPEGQHLNLPSLRLVVQISQAVLQR